MKIKSKMTTIVFLIALFYSFNCFSQGAAPGESNLLEDSITDMYIVSGAGLGGAILGLSTLSFVSEPADHLKNIIVGGALGVIAGVAFVAYNTANKGRDMYQEGYKIDNRLFETTQRMVWHQKGRNLRKINHLSPSINLKLSF